MYILGAVAGFGAKVANPTTVPGDVNGGLAWSPNGNYIAVAGLVYPWTGTGFGNQFAGHSSLPGLVQSLAWSPDGNYIAIGHGATPWISVFPWSSAGFGAKIADPSTLPGGGANAFQGKDVAWSPDGAYIAVYYYITPFISVYPWSAGFGAKLADPSTLPSNSGIGGAVSWSPDGAYIACGATTISVYPWSAGFGAKVADPSTLPPNTVLSLAWLTKQPGSNAKVLFGSG